MMITIRAITYRSFHGDLDCASLSLLDIDTPGTGLDSTFFRYAQFSSCVACQRAMLYFPLSTKGNPTQACLRVSICLPSWLSRLPWLSLASFPFYTPLAILSFHSPSILTPFHPSPFVHLTRAPLDTPDYPQPKRPSKAQKHSSPALIPPRHPALPPLSLPSLSLRLRSPSISALSTALSREGRKAERTTLLHYSARRISFSSV